jgi:hypothetical protein
VEQNSRKSGGYRKKSGGYRKKSGRDRKKSGRVPEEIRESTGRNPGEYRKKPVLDFIVISPV